MIVRWTATRALTASLSHAPWPSPGTKLRNVWERQRPMSLRPAQQLVSCFGRIYSRHEVLTQGISSGNRNVFTNTPDADIIMCFIIYEYTASCVHIELCRYSIHFVTWRIYSSPLLIRPPRHRPPGLYGRIFIAIAFSNTNYLSSAATRLAWPIVKVGWSIFPSSANR